MKQNTLQFSELEPCKHCGGEAIEQWRLATRWDKSEYVAVVFMCNRCTFETSSRMNLFLRDKAVGYWNEGVIHFLSDGKKRMTMNETWDAELQWMGRKRPELRVQKTQPSTPLAQGALW